MANEIPNILEPKEKVELECKPARVPYMLMVVLGALIASGLIGFFAGSYFKSVALRVTLGMAVIIVVLVLGHLAYTRTHYAITNKRAIVQSGIIGRDFKSVDYDKMQNVSVEVGLLGVLFKVGTVKIFTGEMESAGRGRNSRMQAKYDRFNYVSSPYDVLKKLQAHLSKRKENLYSGKT